MNKEQYDEFTGTICAMDSLIDMIISVQASLICQNNKKHIFESCLKALNHLSSMRAFLYEIHESVQDVN